VQASRKGTENLEQGDTLTGIQGTNPLFLMSKEEVKNIPKDGTVTYLKVVIDYLPQTADPNRVQITVHGNLISYPGEITTRTADLVTSKMLWNSVLSNKNARYMTVDIKGFYLNTPLDQFQYMRMPIDVLPHHIIDRCILKEKVKDGHVYM